MKNTPLVDRTSQKSGILKSVASLRAATAKDIYELATKKYGVTVSYQAVHKILKSLCEDGILQFDNRIYTLHRDWASEMYHIVQHRMHEHELCLPYTKDMNYELLLDMPGEVVITFDSRKEFDECYHELRKKMVEKLVHTPLHNRKVYSSSWHLLYPLIYPNKEREILQAINDIHTASLVCVADDNPINRWLEGFYEEHNITIDYTLYTSLVDHVLLYGDVVLTVSEPYEVLDLYLTITHMEKKMSSTILQDLTKKLYSCNQTPVIKINSHKKTAATMRGLFKYIFSSAQLTSPKFEEEEKHIVEQKEVVKEIEQFMGSKHVNAFIDQHHIRWYENKSGKKIALIPPHGVLLTMKHRLGILPWVKKMTVAVLDTENETYNKDEELISFSYTSISDSYELDGYGGIEKVDCHEEIIEKKLTIGEQYTCLVSEHNYLVCNCENLSNKWVIVSFDCKEKKIDVKRAGRVVEGNEYDVLHNEVYEYIIQHKECIKEYLYRIEHIDIAVIVPILCDLLQNKQWCCHIERIYTVMNWLSYKDYFGFIEAIKKYMNKSKANAIFIHSILHKYLKHQRL